MAGEPNSRPFRGALPRWDDPPAATALSQAELAETLRPFRARERLRTFAGAAGMAIVACAIALAITAALGAIFLGGPRCFTSSPRSDGEPWPRPGGTSPVCPGGAELTFKSTGHPP